MTDAKVITVNGTEYTEDQFTDQQRIMINHISDIERKVSLSQFELEQLSVSKQAFVDMLTKSLEEPVEAKQLQHAIIEKYILDLDYGRPREVRETSKKRPRVHP